MKHTTKPKPASRAASTPRLRHGALQELRVRTWYFQVLQAAIPKQLEQYEMLLDDYLPTQQQLDSVILQLGVALQTWINERLLALPASSVSVLTVSSRHVGYFNGTTEPRIATLQTLNELIPDSRLVYDYGDWYGNLPISGEKGQSRLPAWAILGGDKSTCMQYLIDLMPPQAGMTYVGDLDKLQTLLDALTTLKNVTKVTDLPDLGYTQKQAHPLWLCHLERHAPGTYTNKGTIAQKYRRPQPDEVIDEDVVTGYEYPSCTSAILGVIAMWWLLDEPGYEYALEIEWLMVGLCYGVIAYHFSIEVQTDILNLVRLRGAEIDKVISTRNSDILLFDDRWKSVIQVGK